MGMFFGEWVCFLVNGFVFREWVCYFFVDECVVENVYVFFSEMSLLFFFRQHFFQKMTLYGGNVYVTFGKWVCLFQKTGMFSENRILFYFILF